MKATIIIALITYCWAFQLRADTLTVCKDCALKTLKGAIIQAKSQATIYIKTGTYYENNILINKPLTIIGEGLPIIDGQKKGAIITVESDSVTLTGLQIINVGSSYTEDYAAIRVKKSGNFVIKNMVLEDIYFGIYLERSYDGSVYDNIIKGDAKNEYSSGNGIQLWYSKNIAITNNRIEKVRDGIYLEFSNHCNIERNISKQNLRYGLHFMFSNDDEYAHNSFIENGAGVAVMFSKKIIMRYNNFLRNWGAASYGILLKEINDAQIYGNTFRENTVGIQIEGSNRILYQHNTFQNNGWALRVRGACYDNIFTLNNFLHNAFDLAYSSHINTNSFTNNYWSDYTGYDLDKDGIGDVPYRPVKLFSYIVNRIPASIVLLRSLFIDIINFSEKVSPVFTPDDLVDAMPLVKPMHIRK